MCDDEEDECLPVPRRRSLVNRRVNHFGSDTELSPPNDRRQSRLLLNNSLSADSGADETIPTPVQLIALYEKTFELATKNKINAKNAFHFPLVERLPEILDIFAFDEATDSSARHHHEPNFVKAGSIIDTSAKIYGYRVDALHSETQKLNGTIQNQEEDEESLRSIDVSVEPPKKLSPRTKIKSSSYLVTDLSTISLPYEFDFHPFQPSNMCHWPGGVGIDSSYADMVSYTMYSSSDFPLINGFVNFNSRINKEYDDNERILETAAKTICDLIPLREVIKDNEGQDHILGCASLREFSFNEDATESYIETIDECSIMDSSLLSSPEDLEFANEIFNDALSELRDDPSTFYFQELQSAHTFPTTMMSINGTLMQSKMSFVNHIPHLLRNQTNSSEYSYFDSSKLKLFAGPYLWKYTNLLPETINCAAIIERQAATVHPRLHRTRQFKLNLFNDEQNPSLTELMSIHFLQRKYSHKRKRKVLSVTLPKTRRVHSHFQLRLSRRMRPLSDLSSSNYFPDQNLQMLSSTDDDYLMDYDDHNLDFDPPTHDNLLPALVEYDFLRPIHYEKIEFDKNFSKIDAKKLQIQLYDEYNRECDTPSPLPISLSSLCTKLLDQGVISYEKDQIISAFYCMLNNCNKNHLYMKNNFQGDDLIIQKQPFSDDTPLTYSQSMVSNLF